MTFKVLLMGGIGNQLFQVARAVSLKSKKKNVVLIKLVFLKKFIYKLIGHPYQKQWIDIDMLSKNLGINVMPISFFLFLKIFLLFILKKINLDFFFDAPLYNRIGSNIFIDIGYFQDTNHLDENAINTISDALYKLLSIEISYIQKNEISFHIRGGDFLHNDPKIIKKRPNLEKIKNIINDYRNNNFIIKIITDDNYIVKMLKNEYQELIFFNDSPLLDFKELINSNQLYASQSTFCFWAYAIAFRYKKSKLINKEDWIFKNFFIQNYFKYILKN